MNKEAVIKRGFAEFMKNPYWKNYYNKAPSDLCRKDIMLNFGMSICTGKESDIENAIIDDINKLEKTLSREDLQYLLDNAVGGYEQEQYRKLLNALK